MTSASLGQAIDRAVTAVLRDPRSVSAPVADDSGPSAPTGPDGRMTAPGHAPAPTAAAIPVTDTPATLPPGGIADLAARVAAGTATPAGLAADAVRRAARWPGILLDAPTPDTGTPPGAPTRTASRTPSPKPGSLAGIPMAVKDNIDIAGLVTGMGGPTGRHRADRDAAAVQRLRSAGATIIGHLAMRELAWGVTTPGCPNPWRRGLDTGGSSGGSAAAVAAGIVPAALGTDTGGSIRIPAALCGVTGLRPTHGSAPMDGVTPMARDLDTVGALALTAADCLLVHETLAGPGDDAPRSPDGLTVGILSGWRGRVHPAVEHAVDAAADALTDRGVHLVQIDLGSAGLASCVAYVLMLIASSRLHLAAAETHRDAVDGQVLALLRHGARIDADGTLLDRAEALAAAIRREALGRMAERNVAAVLGPVTAVPSVPSGADEVTVGTRTIPVSDALSRYTALAPVTGLPALSLPGGLHEGLPVGVQLMGLPRQERTLALLAGPIECGPGAPVAAERRNLQP